MTASSRISPGRGGRRGLALASASAGLVAAPAGALVAGALAVAAVAAVAVVAPAAAARLAVERLLSGRGPSWRASPGGGVGMPGSGLSADRGRRARPGAA